MLLKMAAFHLFLWQSSKNTFLKNVFGTMKKEIRSIQFSLYRQFSIVNSSELHVLRAASAAAPKKLRPGRGPFVVASRVEREFLNIKQQGKWRPCTQFLVEYLLLLPRLIRTSSNTPQPLGNN